MRVFIRGGVKAEVAAVVGMALIALLSVAVLAVIVVRWFSGQSKEHAPTTTFTDSRDGQTYKTVTIGKQTWMAENLNYKTDSGSWCYNDSISYCMKYGRLYDWKTAAIVCPAGWKLPDTSDWDKLETAAGGWVAVAYKILKPWVFLDIPWGKRLKSKCGWKDSRDKYMDDSLIVYEPCDSISGTDNYGFSALPGGVRDHDDGSFYEVGEYGYWWMASECDGDNACGRQMRYDFDGVFGNDGDKYSGRSVRCVADRP